MYIGNILNSDAELNNFVNLNAINFIPGSAFKLVFQIVNDQTGLRHIPGPNSIVTLNLNNVDSERIPIVTEFFEDDRSIRYVEITSEISAQLNGGNASFSIDELGDGTKIYKGLIANGLAKQIEFGVDNGC